MSICTGSHIHFPTMRFRLPSILFRRVQVPDEGEVVLLVANSLSFSVLQNIHQINVLRSIYSSCSNRHRRTLYLTDEFSLTFPCVAGRSRYSAKAGHPTCLSRRAEMEATTTRAAYFHSGYPGCQKNRSIFQVGSVHHSPSNHPCTLI